MLLTVRISPVLSLAHPLTRADACTALQIGDKYRVTTPVNWKKGEDVIVHPSVTTEEAKTLFPEHTVHKVRNDSVICCVLGR